MEFLAWIHICACCASCAQENGGRTGVKWVLLRPGATSSQQTPTTTGLAAFPLGTTPPLQLNASPYSIHQLHTATHEYQLHGYREVKPGGAAGAARAAAEAPATHLVLDHVHMGVGGDDSWSPSVHPEYLVPPDRYSFSIGFLPVQLSQ